MSITNRGDISLGLAVWLLHDAETGLLYWKKSKGRANAGDIAGSKAKNGYLTVRINGVLYYVHRVVWFLEKGYWPEHIDHINGDRSDNRISNLREATQDQNRKNLRMKVTNKSGFKGVSWHKSWNKWIATITKDRKHILIGGFTYPEEAAIAYDNAAVKLHGNFARTNKSLGLIS